MLSREEIDLLGDASAYPTLTPAMHALKRIGLYRLISRLLEGRAPYPATAALDDTVVDFWLDRVGFCPWGNRWMSSPIGFRIIQLLLRLIS